jgi:hypothetical protein
MDLAMLTGHGPPGLLERDGPLVEPAAVVLLGRRPDELHGDVARENARLDPAIHALTTPEVRARRAASVGTDGAARLAGCPGVAASGPRRARRGRALPSAIHNHSGST